MRFGVFYELQLPKPWLPGDEARLFHEALDQVELADRLGVPLGTIKSRLRLALQKLKEQVEQGHD